MKIQNFKNINIGLAILRIYLSYLIVNAHCFIPSDEYKKLIIIKFIRNSFPVPIFYILSFYFCYNLFSSKNIKKIKIRFQRLLIPYFIWPIIVWSLRNLLSLLFIKVDKLSLKELILQLLTGHIFVPVLWFQYNLIFITLLTVIIHLLFNKKMIFFILINIKIFGIFFTYSNCNFVFFSKYDINIMYTFGRFFEIIPYCITGYIFASLNFVHFLSKNKILTINIFLPILIFFKEYDVLLEINGFDYQGLKLYAESISIFLLFSLIQFERIGNKHIIKFIEFASKSTAGVYYIHLPLSYYLLIFFNFKYNKLSESIIIYFMSYFISIFGKLIFRKTKLINLFQ